VRRTILLTVCCALVSIPATGAVLNVPDSHSTIQLAVDAASPGDTIRVAPGTYRDCTHPSEEADGALACVVMKSGIVLLGSGPGTAIIDAELRGMCIYCKGVNNAVIEGFTLMNADCPAGDCVCAPGVYCRLSSPHIRSCDIGPNHGGDVICAETSAPVISRCNLEGNAGNGRDALHVEDGSNPVVENCTIEGATTPGGNGSALSDTGDSGVRITRSPLVASPAPNPFKQSTTIEFALTEPTRVTLRIYDVTGREVASLRECPMSVGTHRVTWEGTTHSGARASSGIYFYRLTAGNRTQTGRIVMVE